MRSIDYYISRAIEHIVRCAVSILLAGGVMGGIALFGWQVLVYLKSAVWRPYSLLDAIAWVSDTSVPWVQAPTNGLGLHIVCKNIPLSIALIVSGVFLGFMLQGWLNGFAEKNAHLYGR